MEKCIKDMPREVIICISQHLTWKDIINFSNTCVWFKLAVFYEMKNRSDIYIKKALKVIKRCDKTGVIIIKTNFSVFRGRCFKKVEDFRFTAYGNYREWIIASDFIYNNLYYGNRPLMSVYPKEYLEKNKNKNNLVI